MAAGDLHDLALEYLDACAAAVATTAGGAIAHRFVSSGLPPLDCCPQLTVHVGGPAQADTLPLLPPLQPAERTQTQGYLPLVQMTCTVVRCVPVPSESGNPPAAATLTAAALLTDQDVWAVWNWIASRHRANSLFTQPSGKREMFMDAAFALNNSGGCGGWQIPVRVELGGYEP